MQITFDIMSATGIYVVEIEHDICDLNERKREGGKGRTHVSGSILGYSTDIIHQSMCQFFQVKLHISLRAQWAIIRSCDAAGIADLVYCSVWFAVPCANTAYICSWYELWQIRQGYRRTSRNSNYCIHKWYWYIEKIRWYKIYIKTITKPRGLNIETGTFVCQTRGRGFSLHLCYYSQTWQCMRTCYRWWRTTQ